MSNGYGRTATIVVASSNASSASQNAADYLCTGTDDDVEIQEAIHTLTSPGSGVADGGRVILTEGAFFCNQPIYLDATGITLEGQGQATSLQTMSSLTSPSGTARVVIGSNGAFDGITYLSGDSAPLAAPLGVIVRGFNFYDYSSSPGYPRMHSTGTSTTSGSTTVDDTHAAPGDAGKTITGSGIPANTTIVSVIASVSYAISQAANANATNPVLTIGLAVPGSSSGLICRGGDAHISDINVNTVRLDGLRWEGFRQMGTLGAGTAGTLTTAVTTAPAWGTPETWYVSMTSPPTAPFVCIVTPASGTDYDPEIINVTATGTTWTVQRGWMQTTSKAHAVNSVITVLGVNTMYNNIAKDCYSYSALRSGVFTQQGVDDSEWYACIIDGGGSPTSLYTENGIWTGGSGLRFIGCHPYYCQNDGLLANPQIVGGTVAVDIIGGEYETNGAAGIEIQQGNAVTVTGGVSFYANGQNDIVLGSTTNFRISDNWLSSGEPMEPTPYQHLQVYECQQGTIHDNTFNGDLGTGDLIEVTGFGPNVNLEIDVHDNLVSATGGTGPSIALVNAAGVRVHDNTCETGIAESGTSDYNVISGNTMVNAVSIASPVVVSGAHTRAYDNTGASPVVIVGSGASPTAQPDQTYALNGSTGAVTLSTPGAAYGGTALSSTGVVLNMVTSLALAAAPTAWPQSGIALVPVTAGYHVAVYYSSIIGNTLEGCSAVGTSGADTTAAGTVYLCPDPSTSFRAVATSVTHTVEIAWPTAMLLNGGTSALTLATANVLHTAVLAFNSNGQVNWIVG